VLTREAIVVLRRALELDPGSVRARLGLGAALGSMKQFDAAVGEFKEVIRIDERNANAMHNLSVTFHQMGQKDLAVNYYRQAEAIRRSGNSSEH
jgi:ribosomal protein S12 methylthiotransferase accessory factor